MVLNISDQFHINFSNHAIKNSLMQKLRRLKLDELSYRSKNAYYAREYAKVINYTKSNASSPDLLEI